MSIKSIADYTKDRLSRAFQYFPLGWLGKAKVEKSPQSETVFKEKLKQVISSQGHHVRFLPYADRYTEETDEIRKAYPVMLRDPYIKQALYTKVFGVASLDLQMHSASKSSRDKEIAEFAKHCIQKCRGGSRRAIMSIAIPGAIFGYSVTEINLRKPTSRGQFGQKITIESLKSKDVNKVQLEGDEFGNISGVRDKITNQFYHASNFLIYSHMPLFETPTGISDFRAAYRAYWLADTAWQLRAIGLERYGLPVIKGTYRTDAEQFALEQSLPNLRSQGWITVPEGALVEAMDIAARGTTDFESAIRDLREEMVLAIAGAILQMLTTTGTAEMRGSADVQKGTFELLQWYLAQESADVLNDQLFPQLIDLNYRGADYPTCTFGGVNDGAMKDSITVDQFFLQSNLPLSKEEMYEKYGRQQPLSEDDAVTSPQAQQPQMPFGGGGGFGGGQFAEDGIDPQATVADQAKQIMGIQQVYAAGKIPRSAAIANAQLIKPDLAPDAAAALFPLRQAMPDGSAKFDESFAEKWITIGGKSGDDGKKKNGGRRVIIDDATGEIKGGAVPKAWQGKKVGDKETYAKGKAGGKKGEKPEPEQGEKDILDARRKVGQEMDHLARWSGARGFIGIDPELKDRYDSLRKEHDELGKKLAAAQKPERDRKEKEDQARKDTAWDKEKARIANLPVMQRKNGWEIVTDGANYFVRDPHTKEDIYKGKLSRARQVASESPPDKPVAPAVKADPTAKYPERPADEKEAGFFQRLAGRQNHEVTQTDWMRANAYNYLAGGDRRSQQIKQGLGTEESRKKAHRDAVDQALASGKSVPPEVLADYPDLAAKRTKPAANPAKNPAKPAAKPAPTPDAPVTDTERDHVLKSLEGSPVHDIADLRKKLAKQLPGAKFDKAILDLADNRKIQVSQDSDPNRWTAEQRKQFVVEGDKVYTNVMVHPSAAANPSIDSLSPSKSIPWKGASVEDEHRWFGSKITVAPRDGDAKRGEVPQIGTLTRVLNKGDLVEFLPVGSAVAFRVPADRVSVDEIKDSGTKVKPPAQPVETPLQSPPSPSRPVLREIPAERVAKARAKVMQDPVAGVVLLGIGQSIKEAKDGKANSSDVFERSRKQLAKLHPTEIDNVAKAFGIDTDKLFKHGNRANLVADAISQKFAPANEKWSMSNPPATPFLPTSLISKVLKGSNTRFAALFKETGDFTDGRVMISAPSWRNLKVVRDYQPHEMEKNAGQIFASTMKKTRDEAFANRSSERAGVVARRMHAGEPHYGLSDGARAESVNGRYHELILKTHPGASVHLNKKEGEPISYVKDGVPVAVLMPMGSNHVKPPVSAPPPEPPISTRGRRNRPAQFDDEIDSGVASSPPSQSIYWPDIRQEHSWDCGPAEIVASGRFCGIAMPPVDYVARECGSHETQDTAPGKLVRVMKAYGIDCQPKANMSFGTLRAHLAEGRPCVVHVTNWDGEDHYIAIIGNDGGMLEYHDPDGGYGQISEPDFAQHWDGVDRFGVRYPRWGVAIIGRRGDGPGHAQQFDDGPRDSIIADAPHQDTDNAIRLSQASQQNGVEVVAKITEDAVTRLARLANPLQAASLFTMEERQALSDALASTLATADLLGRSRTHIRAEQVRRKAGGYKFSEPTSFQRFDDDPAPEAARVSALPPSRALEYFASLVPTITVAPTYAADVAGRAFTLAGVTETNILQRVKDVIQGRLETGQAFRAAPMDIQRVLDDAGISVRNPQYSEQVFRTNIMEAYNRGSMESMRDPDVVDLFPAWQYHGIRDGRQRLQHQAHFGRYFPNSLDFDVVRDHFYDGEFSGYSCRCVPSPISKYEWKRLQERGESISELGSYPMPLS